nr:zinc finger protein 761-like [Parasteatoda tepidariorum]
MYASHMKRHQLVHTQERPFTCSVCFKSFNHKVSLLCHTRLHTGEKPFSCELLHFIFFKNILIILGRKQEHKCTICSYVAPHACVLKQHMKKHTQERPFACHLCPKAFNYKNCLDNHLCKHTGIKPYKCQICLREFSVKQSLKRHMLIHLPKLGYVFEKPLKHRCLHCGYLATHLCRLKQHMKVHTQERPYACSLCPGTFNHKTSLISHMYSHTGKMPYRCEICLKEFAFKYSYKRHMLIHASKKQNKFSKNSYDNGLVRVYAYACYETCEISETAQTYKVYYSPNECADFSSLDRRFSCHLCPKTFRQKVSLIAHMCTHTGRKPFQCQNYFPSETVLSLGQELYAIGSRTLSFTDVQDYRFPDFDTLSTLGVDGNCVFASVSVRDHRSKQTVFRPFACPMCPKTFNSKVSLDAHLCSHTGQKLFKCQICSREFSFKHSLKRHQMIVHGKHD